jgi:NAD+ kinase
MTATFTTIGLVGKHTHNNLAELREISELLHRRGKTVVLDAITARQAPDLPHHAITERDQLGKRADLVIVVGGDGTMLDIARSLARYDVPMLGINLGRLGFLTDISPNEIQEKLGGVLDGDFWEERRALLFACVERNGKRINESEAFNDVVLHKWMGARMLEFDTFIDGKFINTTRADGLIVSTPTGSTGYALSGGGPIVHPSLNAIVIVPICPHTMSHRPIVVSGDSVIELVVNETAQSDAQVTCDGQINLGLQPNDSITVSKSQHSVRLIHPAGHDYYDMLRAKLRWGERL